LWQSHLKNTAFCSPNLRTFEKKNPFFSPNIHLLIVVVAMRNTPAAISSNGWLTINKLADFGSTKQHFGICNIEQYWGHSHHIDSVYYVYLVGVSREVFFTHTEKKS